MLETRIIHHTHRYSDQELFSVITSYLEREFVFKKLELELWLGNDRVIFKRRDDYDSDLFTNGKCAEELWHDGEFENWKTCTPLALKNIFKEFIFRRGAALGKGRTRYIMDILKAETSYGSMIETIHFNPKLKDLINLGRGYAKNIKPLNSNNSKRVNILLNEEDECYFCWSTKRPYVANPAFVFKKLAGSYIIIFFYNESKGVETSKQKINMARFINAPSDEIGTTPQQAILQRFC